MNVATILKSKGQAVTTARPDTALLDIAPPLSDRMLAGLTSGVSDLAEMAADDERLASQADHARAIRGDER